MFTELTEILGVPENVKFSCKAYYYKVMDNKLYFKHVKGWRECCHSEVIYVYSKKDLIQIEGD